jgi:asparagine synthase (glutamine-hydrolysing)
LYTYLQLNYIPAPDTIFTHVKKLLPGHYIKIGRQKIDIQPYYEIPYNHDKAERNSVSYDVAKENVKLLLEQSVQRRLVSDVPLGAFLSGGIDSSIVTGLASKHKPDLHTFSIGFKDEKFFDETHYARLVAKHFKTQHTVFSLTNHDLYTHLNTILDYIDEPFADSSAIAVYILSKETRKHATVALSGDGADEMLAGYNKHAAFNRVINPGLKENVVLALGPLWKLLPKSRNGSISNKIRQLARFSEGMKLSAQDRYWQWAGYATKEETLSMLHPNLRTGSGLKDYLSRRKTILQTLPERENINDVLLLDMKLVLPNDMLTKVDLMSMANGLEVRVPFLDFEFVNYIFSLPSHYKITGSLRKRIVKDAFRDLLPEELYHRPKKGFEVPLLKWFRHEMKSLITDDLLSERFINEQQIFDYTEIQKLKAQLFSSNPGDIHARIWGLIVFQWWWKKYMANQAN